MNAEQAFPLSWPPAWKRAAFREAAFKSHPDNGGSHEAMVEINAAWDQARATFNGARP